MNDGARTPRRPAPTRIPDLKARGRHGPRTSAAVRIAVATITGLTLTLGGLTLSPTANAATAYLVAGDVNVRSGPGTSHPILGVLTAGNTVSGAAASGGWVKVDYHGATGYVSASYLTTAQPPTPDTDDGSVAYGAATTAVLAMRTTPSIDAKSAGTLDAGTEISLTGKHSGSYSQIVRQDGAFWVLTRYLMPTGEAAPTLPKATGERYVKVDEVNIRATSVADGQRPAASLNRWFG